MQRASGILVHPTSFPSRYGIGDLGKGAYDFLDFLHQARQRLWQVLPLSPTSFGDSPYQSFSTFAGSHLLISPDKLAEEGWLAPEDLPPEVPEFDSLSVDYGAVIDYKTGLFKTAFENFKKRASDGRTQPAPAGGDYNAFCAANKSWLEDYALFVALKNHFIAERKFMYETPEYTVFEKENETFLSPDEINDYFYGAVWASWPDELRTRKKSALDQWTKKLSDEIEFQKFLQYEFFKQWGELKQQANALDIKIIGDIPIFVAMDSADVWSNPELFYLDEKGYPTVVAGVPPDYFSETGQLWGNPLYNWEKHAADGYAWWKERISATLKIVDILRIDHFRGFEAYWAVPYGSKTAEKGKWRKGPGGALFKAVHESLGQLPIIAEDLGVITDAVTELRTSNGFPGMKVLQFAFDEPDNEYLPHNFTDPNVVVYTGTHDNDTTVGWYEQSGARAKDFVRRYMNISGADIAWDMIRLAFSTTAAYALTTMQDLLALGTEHRMNIPGVASGNWKFRYPDGALTTGHAEGLAYFTKMFNRIPLPPRETEDPVLTEGGRHGKDSLGIESDAV
ncbi:MAG: 4-alpha-glucanotransferase [Clostridiales bacterium]|jgi:4-alpha-glucanotransferase|nr:4-alpha-glucanotransferase [Clostridiales bacterium]